MDLHASEIRVLGCLLEKQRSTPEHYPLTLNALRLACNQSTNREPVVEYDDREVREAVRRLERRGMARFAGGAGSRAPKYRHLLSEALPMDDEEQALLCVMMLRGPQTPGELKQRSERLHRFDDLDAVHETLRRLIDRGLAVCAGRRRGQKEERYTHLLDSTTPSESQPQAVAAQPSDSGSATQSVAGDVAGQIGEGAPGSGPSISPLSAPPAVGPGSRSVGPGSRSVGPGSRSVGPGSRSVEGSGSVPAAGPSLGSAAGSGSPSPTSSLGERVSHLELELGTRLDRGLAERVARLERILESRSDAALGGRVARLERELALLRQDLGIEPGDGATADGNGTGTVESGEMEMVGAASAAAALSSADGPGGIGAGDPDRSERADGQVEEAGLGASAGSLGPAR